MKAIIFSSVVAVLLGTTALFSQDMRATCDDGRTVILKANGTWFFISRDQTEDGSAVTFDGRAVTLKETGKWILTNSTRAVPSAAHPSSMQPSREIVTTTAWAHAFLTQDGAEIITAAGTAADRRRISDKKVVLLYFSGSWCPPCHGFTPKLVQFYHQYGGGDKFEILFVSCDKNEEAMMDYMKEANMPWLALSWASSSMGAAVKQKYCGPGIPCLVMLNERDEVVSDSYVGAEYVGPSKVLGDLKTWLRTE
jgi:thiol-disulfide isomerase/thioredoxin